MHSRRNALGTTLLSSKRRSRRDQHHQKAETLSFPFMLVACRTAEMSRRRERNCKVESRRKCLDCTRSTPETTPMWSTPKRLMCDQSPDSCCAVKRTQCRATCSYRGRLRCTRSLAHDAACFRQDTRRQQCHRDVHVTCTATDMSARRVRSSCSTCAVRPCNSRAGSVRCCRTFPRIHNNVRYSSFERLCHGIQQHCESCEVCA